MQNFTQTAEIMRSMVPVSRFNKGEASKIFDEVAKHGIRIAVKNNKPACVMLSPERYEELLDEIWDLELMMEVERRLSDENAKYISREEMMEIMGVTEADIDAAEDVEIE